MIEGWLESKGAYYYLNNGKMIAGKTVTIGGTDYRFDANGACTSAIGNVSVTHAGDSTSSTGSTTVSSTRSNAVTATTPGGTGSSTATTPGGTATSTVTTSEPGTSTNAGPGGVSQYETTTQISGPTSTTGSSNVATSSPVSTTTSSSGTIEELQIGRLTGPM